MNEYLSPHGDAPPPRPLSVLIVEDNETTRAHIATVLHRRGHAVSEAVDGLDALKKVSSSPYDVIVLDLVMPHVDGWQFRETQLRHPELAAIPTVVVTIRPLQHPDRYALRAADVVQKPFDDGKLLNAIERAARPVQVATTMAPGRVSTLFWSRHGEIACSDHAPAAGSTRWTAERWAPIPPGAGRDRVVYQCQHCDARGTPIAHRRRDAEQ